MFILLLLGTGLSIAFAILFCYYLIRLFISPPLDAHFGPFPELLHQWYTCQSTDKVRGQLVFSGSQHLPPATVSLYSDSGVATRSRDYFQTYYPSLPIKELTVKSLDGGKKEQIQVEIVEVEGSRQSFTLKAGEAHQVPFKSVFLETSPVLYQR